MLSLISRPPVPPLYQSAALVPPSGRWTGELIERREQEALLRALQQALRARLSRDSAGHPEHAQELPAETASLRTLTFRSARLTIELEVGHDCLIGQIIPAQPAVMRVEAGTPPDPAIRFDEHSCFIVQPVPHARFRLHCRTAASIEVQTGWTSR